MTIIGAITEVLNDNKPRTAKMIYEEIVEIKPYNFSIGFAS